MTILDFGLLQVEASMASQTVSMPDASHLGSEIEGYNKLNEPLLPEFAKRMNPAASNIDESEVGGPPISKSISDDKNGPAEITNVDEIL